MFWILRSNHKNILNELNDRHLLAPNIKCGPTETGASKDPGTMSGLWRCGSRTESRIYQSAREQRPVRSMCPSSFCLPPYPHPTWNLMATRTLSHLIHLLPRWMNGVAHSNSPTSPPTNAIHSSPQSLIRGDN